MSEMVVEEDHLGSLSQVKEVPHGQGGQNSKIY